jgi:hypothetical protein
VRGEFERNPRRSFCAEWVKSVKPPRRFARAVKGDKHRAMPFHLKISEHEKVVLAELVAMP